MPLLFAVTLFVSAFLLFLVQPMIAQMILPLLGGTPAVWNTCMVFFQAALLAGYAYTHSATTYMPVKKQTLLHACLLVVPFAFFVMPFAIGDWTPATEANPVWSVLFVLLTTVGLPFFVVATSAPLLQRWFGSTGHASAKDPYFLYGASNLGSMLALLSYPFLFQPAFELPTMAQDLDVCLHGADCPGVDLRASGLVGSSHGAIGDGRHRAETGTLASSPGAAERDPPADQATLEVGADRGGGPHRHANPQPPTDLAQAAALDLPGCGALELDARPYDLHDNRHRGDPIFLDRAVGTLFAFVHSRLCAWPVPWTAVPHRLLVYAQPAVLLGLGVFFMAGWWNTGDTFWQAAPHLAAFFICTMVCHGELAKDRPDARHLTEFYLCMSIGGVAGGVFNALIAPVVFTQAIEYFLVLLVVLFLRPQTHFWHWVRRRPEPADDHSLVEYFLDIGYAACLGLLAYALLKVSLNKNFVSSGYDFTGWLRERFYVGAFGMAWSSAASWARWTELLLIEGIPVGICLAFAGRPVRIGLAVIGLFAVNYFMLFYGDGGFIYQNRSFFSVQRMRLDKDSDESSEQARLGTYHVLMHGGIDHGRQNLDPGPAAQAAMKAAGIPYFDPDNKRDQPISYFFPTNPLGQVFMKFRNMDSKPPFAVVGLGTGTMASYARTGQTMDIYEIDAAVLHLSEPPDGSEPYFHYLQDAKKRGVNLKVILGDGRLKIKDAPPKYYQIILLDAFSSDAIPVHLMTKEAIALYLSKLKDDGVLIFNITNRYVRLAPVLADLAKEFDMVCLEQGDGTDRRIPEKFGTDWFIMFPRPKNGDKMAGKAASVVGGFAPAPVDFAALGGVGAAAILDNNVPFTQRIDASRWNVPEPSGMPVWTDHYQNMIPMINWFGAESNEPRSWTPWIIGISVLLGAFVVTGALIIRFSPREA